jgi:hypothetical protein
MRNPNRPSVWIPGINFRDRLALWFMAQRLDPWTDLSSPAVLQAACDHARYPISRCRQIQKEFPRAWEWVQWQQYLRRRGLPNGASAGRARAAMITSLKTRHKGILKRLEGHNGRPIEEIL